MIPKFKAFTKTYGVIDVLEIDFRFKTIEFYVYIDGAPHAKTEYIENIELIQSTGLKDKNGVEIFDGDVLKGLMDFGLAGFVESVAPVSYHKINGYQLHYFLLEHTEVIGNVYEHPYLLEE